MEGNLAFINLLLQNKATIDALNYFEQTPLFLAAFYGHWACIKILIQQGGADINICDSCDASPLRIAQIRHAKNIDYEKLPQEETSLLLALKENERGTPDFQVLEKQHNNVVNQIKLMRAYNECIALLSGSGPFRAA